VYEKLIYAVIINTIIIVVVVVVVVWTLLTSWILDGLSLRSGGGCEFACKATNKQYAVYLGYIIWPPVYVCVGAEGEGNWEWSQTFTPQSARWRADNTGTPFWLWEVLRSLTLAAVLLFWSVQLRWLLSAPYEMHVELRRYWKLLLSLRCHVSSTSDVFSTHSYTTLFQTTKLSYVVTFLTCVREVTCSNLGWDTVLN